MLPVVSRPFLLALSASLVVAGCSLAPVYERPGQPVPAQYPNTTAGTDDLTAPSAVELGWSELFKDPQLQALIDIALENNRDLRIAVDRVEEARALFGISRADRFPSIGVGGNLQATRSPESLRMGGPNSESVSRVYMAGVGLTAFELDFFGRVRNLSEAAYQRFLATEQAQRTVHINLVAQVAEAYFRYRTALELEELMQKTLISRQNTLELVQARYDSGVASALDLHQAQAQLETVRADLAAIDRLRSQSVNALQLILGTAIPAELPPAAIFGREQLLARIPAGLPSDLLERRPDILAAENNLRAANANIGAARAAFFPNISITGLLGFASPQLGGLFGSGNRYWQFAPQIQLPLFEGGALSGNLALAEARQNIAVSEYERAIQVAFREVADALAGEATYSGQLDALRELQNSGLQTVELAKLRYETGVDSFLQVQNAEVNLYATQRQLIQTGMESLLNRIELYKALGGGWNEDTVVLQVDGGETGVATGQ